MPAPTLPTAADALHALVPSRIPGVRITAAWPPRHRLLATTAGMLLCLLAGVGCTDTRAAAVPSAVTPSYSYLRDASPEAQRHLWSHTPGRAGTLLAGAP